MNKLDNIHAGEMDRWMKAPAAQHGDLSSLPRPVWRKERTDLRMCTVAYMHTQNGKGVKM